MKPSIQQLLKVKLAHSSLQDIALLMGYNKKSVYKAASRIEHLLSDPTLGLYTGQFDFKYSNQEFLNKLCEVAGIQTRDHYAELNAIHDYQQQRRGRFHSYIFIDTGFKRKNEPIFVLSLMSSKRFIQLDCEVQLLPIAEQVEYVKAIIPKHYKSCHGEIPLWGAIQSYVFFYAEESSLEFNVDGVIMQDNPCINIPQATLLCSGKDVTSLLIR